MADWADPAWHHTATPAGDYRAISIGPLDLLANLCGWRQYCLFHHLRRRPTLSKSNFWTGKKSSERSPILSFAQMSKVERKREKHLRIQKLWRRLEEFCIKCFILLSNIVAEKQLHMKWNTVVTFLYKETLLMFIEHPGNIEDWFIIFKIIIKTILSFYIFITAVHFFKFIVLLQDENNRIQIPTNIIFFNAWI